MAKSAPAAIVTGAANGIGSAIARSLIRSGWRVAALDLAGTGLARRFAKLRRAIMIEGDVAEMTTGVWDGFVPYVMGSPQSIPNCFTVRVNALRVLKHKWPSIIDAIEPGGSGDPYAGLNDEERAALEEATRAGFPPRAWFNYVPQGGGPLVLVASYVPVLDPTYLDDFWSKPGYLGTDPTSSVGAARIQHEAAVVDVVQGHRQPRAVGWLPAH